MYNAYYVIWKYMRYSKSIKPPAGPPPPLGLGPHFSGSHSKFFCIAGLMRCKPGLWRDTTTTIYYAAAVL